MKEAAESDGVSALNGGRGGTLADASGRAAAMRPTLKTGESSGASKKGEKRKKRRRADLKECPREYISPPRTSLRGDASASAWPLSRKLKRKTC